MVQDEKTGILPEETGWKRYGLLLKRHYRKLFQMELLVLLSALPVVTLPAGIAGANRVFIKLIREGNVLVWQEWKEGFLNSLRESIVLGAFYCLLLFWGSWMAQSSALTLRCLGLLVIFGSLLWATSTFYLLAVQELTWGKLLKNGCILLFLGIRETGLLALLLLIELAGGVLLFPYSLFSLILGIPALFHFTKCWVLWGPVERLIVMPWEQGRK